MKVKNGAEEVSFPVGSSDGFEHLIWPAAVGRQPGLQLHLREGIGCSPRLSSRGTRRFYLGIPGTGF